MGVRRRVPRSKPSADFKLTAPTPVRPPDAPEGVVTEAHQVVVKFGGADGQPFRDDLPHDNIAIRHLFCARRSKRRVLVLDDDPDPAGDLKKKPGVFWYAALEAYKKSHPEGYHCDLRPAADAAKLRLKDLEPYRVVCLFQNAKPLPDDFCTALEEYVNDGGGVAIVPPTAPLAGDGLQQWNAAPGFAPPAAGPVARPDRREGREARFTGTISGTTTP